MFKYWIIFIGSVALFYFFSLSPFYINHIEGWIGVQYAKVSSLILNFFGMNVLVADGQSMSNNVFSMQIAKGCDAVLPMVMVAAAIGSYPLANWNSKWKGILLGALMVVLINIIRIISLFLIGIHAKDWFEFFHIEFWQIVFILFVIVYYIWWIKRNAAQPAKVVRN